jgi:surface-anchored protein
MFWKDGFPPTFGFSSCDGIAPSDAFALALGHDHFNVGFSDVGEYVITYEVTGTLIVDGSTVTTQFSVNYLME